MKRSIFFLVAVLCISLLFSACSNESATNDMNNTPKENSQENNSELPGIAMVTNGSMDDHSFNEMLWEGLASAGDEMGFEPSFIEFAGNNDEEILANVKTLYDSGVRLIFMPGGALAGAAASSAEEYADLKIVLIDAMTEQKPNLVSTAFAIEQAGFVAGVASAVELDSAEFGFLGGMEIPFVQYYNWGFQQGLLYANRKYGTSASMKAENVIYEGSFGNYDGGKNIAEEMYGRGVSAILVAAGQTGMGAFEAAMDKSAEGDRWIIAVDFDQYERGLASDGSSIILTSAVKNYGAAAYEMSRALLEDRFPGGSELTMDASYVGIGIPSENPNLSADAVEAAEEALEAIASGSISVADNPDGLIP